MSGYHLPEHGPQSTVAYGDSGAFNKFLSWTDEKIRLTEALELEVNPGHETLLDVGAGDGSITRPLSEEFKSVVALEPSGAFGDAPSNVSVLPDDVQSFLATNDTQFDFVLASHVFIYVPNPTEVLAKLNDRVKPGGRLAVVMLEGNSEFQRFIDAFAKEANPQLKQRSTFKSSHLMLALDQMRVRWRRNLITTSLVAPSVDEFLGINDMLFNCETRALPEDLLARMRAHLDEHVDENGHLVLDLQHGIYVVEH